MEIHDLDAHQEASTCLDCKEVRPRYDLVFTECVCVRERGGGPSDDGESYVGFCGAGNDRKRSAAGGGGGDKSNRQRAQVPLYRAPSLGFTATIRATPRPSMR